MNNKYQYTDPRGDPITLRRKCDIAPYWAEARIINLENKNKQLTEVLQSVKNYLETLKKHTEKGYNTDWMDVMQIKEELNDIEKVLNND